jgi:hypothetical protein
LVFYYREGQPANCAPEALSFYVGRHAFVNDLCHTDTTSSWLGSGYLKLKMGALTLSNRTHHTEGPPSKSRRSRARKTDVPAIWNRSKPTGISASSAFYTANLCPFSASG